MKKILIAFFLISFLSSAITISAAPAWVPPNKIEQFDRVIKSAKEYAAILKADPKIIDSKVVDHITDNNGKRKKGIFLVSTVKRGTLTTEVILEIDTNDKIENVTINNGVVSIEYESQITLKDKLKYAGFGGISGALVTFIIMVLI